MRAGPVGALPVATVAGLVAGLTVAVTVGALPVAAVAAGLVAGLAIAVPLGAIGVLILQQGLRRGWAAAAAAATGVALVDLAYASVALVCGAVITSLMAGRARIVHLIGAAVLIGVALHGLRSLRAAPVPAVRAATAGQPEVRAARTVGRFVAMTAVNPLTAIYFVVLAAGLGPSVAGWRAGAGFAVGVFLGSWAWQLVLACVGSFAGARLPSWASTAGGAVGYLVVLSYAARWATGG